LRSIVGTGDNAEINTRRNRKPGCDENDKRRSDGEKARILTRKD